MRKFLLGLICGLVVVGGANMGFAFKIDFWNSGGNSHKRDHHIAQTVNQLASVPDPATLILLGIGLIGLASFGRKNFK